MAQKLQANERRVQALQEGFGAIRDVLLNDTQTSYLNYIAVPIGLNGKWRVGTDSRFVSCYA